MTSTTHTNPALKAQGELQAPVHDGASVHLDMLRGFAGFSVMISHWRDMFFVDYSHLHSHGLFLQTLYFFTGLGHQWVIIFFSLSGYLVGGSVLRAVESKRWNWRSYLFVRLTRLYTVLIPAMILAAVCLTLAAKFPGAEFLYDLKSGQREFGSEPRLVMTVQIFFQNLFFLQGFTLPGMKEVIRTFGGDGPLWSLSYEFWYYIAFPMLVLMLTRSRSKRERIFYLLGAVLWCWGNGWERIVMGITWLAGAAIFFLPALPAKTKSGRRLWQALSLLLMLVGLILFKHWFNLVTTVVMGFITMFLIWVILSCSKGQLPLAYTRIARLLSHTSYTMYLVHLPFLGLMKAAFHVERIDHFELRHTLLVAGILVATLIYTYLVYLAFEKNTDKIRKWLTPYILRPKRA